MCNAMKKSSEYNLIVDIFQGISNHVVRIKVKRMLVCVCAASKLQNIYWPACARFSNSSLFDAWSYWCISIFRMSKIVYTHSFLWLSNVSLSLSSLLLCSITPSLFSLWWTRMSKKKREKLKNFFFGIWLRIENSFLLNLMSVEFGVCRFIIIIIYKLSVS